MKLTTVVLLLSTQFVRCTWATVSRRDVAKVQTSSGLVSGHAASDATTVSEYLGIPFAIPPVGKLRFSAPQKLEAGSDTVVNGTDFGFTCWGATVLEPVSSMDFKAASLTAAGKEYILRDAQVNDTFSEDCLTLNIWVPSGGEDSKAVMLWVYGGSFTTGGSSITSYNGQFIADQEKVIVVTINYRLGIFGFPPSPSLEKLNPGLLDQRLAIEWVRDNIKAFGGDPTRITAFGQSAGSDSLDLYSYAYPEDPILSGLILESGTVSLLPPIPTINGTAAWSAVVSNLTCEDTSSDSSKELSCMQTQDPLTLLSSVGILGISAAFQPTVDNITVFDDYPARTIAGNFSKIPLLIGNNDDESSLFAVQALLQGGSVTTAEVQAGNLLRFTCPSGVRANASVANQIPTWRYRYFGVFPNTELTVTPDSGAWHESEIAVLFDTLPTGDGIPDSTTAEKSIAAYMRGAWAAFARDSTNGLNSYDNGSWPRYLPTESTLIRLAYNNVTGTNLESPALYDVGCEPVFPIPGLAASGSATPTSSPSPSATGASPAQSSKPSAASGLFIRSGSSAILATVVVFVIGVMNNCI